MPRVGIDVKTLSLHKAGISTLVRALLPDLVAIDTRLEYVAFGPSEALGHLPSEVQPIAVELRKLGRARIPFYDQVQLRWAIGRSRVDLFYSPHFDAPVGLRVPTVVTMHDAAHFRYPGLYPRFQRVYYRRLMRAHGRHAAAIITDSQFSKSELVERVGVVAARVRVIYPALSTTFGQAVPVAAARAVRDRYSLGDAYVLYPGGVEPRKNVIGLLQAYALWRRRRGGRVPLLALTGHVSRYARYISVLRSVQLEDVVRFPGHIADQDMPHVYAGATAVIYPSLYEGFGLPLLEAMTVGVPIACSRRGSLPEIEPPPPAISNRSESTTWQMRLKL